MIRLAMVDEANFQDIPESCRRCFYWQTTTEFSGKDMIQKKEKKRLEWFLQMKRKTDCSGGFIAYQDSTPVGFVQCAAAKYLPNVRDYPSGQVSKDAAFLACLYVPTKEIQKKGIGTQMLKAELAHLRQQGFKAVETFARKSSPENPSGPLTFYLKNGFKIKHDETDFPLVRLEFG